MNAASVEAAVNMLMTCETLGSSHWIQKFFPNWMFQPSETTDRQLAEVTPHPTYMGVRNVRDDADSAPYKNSGVSMQSAGEIAGTSGIQSNKHEATFKTSPQDILCLGDRKRGRPKKRWINDVEQGLRKLGVSNWRSIAGDRQRWRAVVREAKVHPGL
jgi:hypothetical protein